MAALTPVVRVRGTDWLVPSAIGAGVAALAVREVALWAVVVTAGVGVLGVITRVVPQERAGLHLASIRVVTLGAAPFILANTWLSPSFAHATLVTVAASLVAAVAEELFFRRLVYGWLERWGPAVAIVVSAVIFAAVHLPIYGPTTIAINLAAGLIFGWQRWATGSWQAPAITHALANVLGAY